MDIKIETYPVGQMRANCYLIIDGRTKSVVIIDPGDDGEYLSDHLGGLNPKMILATHGHFDHIMAGFFLQFNHQIPFIMHEADRFLLDRMKSSAEHFLDTGPTDPPPRVSKTLTEGDVICVDNIRLEVINAPGHTPGSVVYKLSGVQAAFVGDTVFADGLVGRVDFSYSDKSHFRNTVDRISQMPDDTKLYPGHGPPVSVGQARQVLAAQRVYEYRI